MADGDERDAWGRLLKMAREGLDDLADGLATLPPGEVAVRVRDVANALEKGARGMVLAVDELQRAPTLATLLDEAGATLRARAEGRAPPVPLPWPDLAKIYGGGLYPGAHVLVGATGTGKTALQLQLALHAAREGVPVLYVGLEMGNLDVVARLLALLEEARPGRAPGAGAYDRDRPGVWASDLMHGQVVPERLDELLEVAGHRLAALPFRVETGDALGWDYLQLEPRVRALREAHSVAAEAPVLVVLDYLQLVSSPASKPREDVRERVKGAAYAAQRVAAACNAAVLVVSSTARTNDKVLRAWGAVWPGKEAEVAGDKWRLSDLQGLGKEAGEVEYSAHTVAVMAPTTDSDGSGPRRIRYGLAKVRYGKPAAETTLLFTGSRWDADPKREAAVAEAGKKAEQKKAEKVAAKKAKGSKGAGKAAGVEKDLGL